MSCLIKQKAQYIKSLILDVDGVLTDGTILLTEDGQELKRFHTQDGLGIHALQQCGIVVAIISSRKSKAVDRRAKELGINHFFQGRASKIEVFQELLTQLQLPLSVIAYMGDDLSDLPIMKKVGLSIAPANAVALVKQQAHWTTQARGGCGAVREVCDFIIETQAS